MSEIIYGAEIPIEEIEGLIEADLEPCHDKDKKPIKIIEIKLIKNKIKVKFKRIW